MASNDTLTGDEGMATATQLLRDIGDSLEGYAAEWWNGADQSTQSEFIVIAQRDGLAAAVKAIEEVAAEDTPPGVAAGWFLSPDDGSPPPTKEIAAMATEVKHTSTPWYVAYRTYKNGFARHIFSESENRPRPHGTFPIARVLGDPRSSDVNDANAEFLCRAANCHDELVAACKDAYLALHALLHDSSAAHNRHEAHNAVAACSAALAKAEE